MKDKILSTFLPIIWWKYTDGFLSKVHLILATIAALWIYSSLSIYIYLTLFYSHFNYGKLDFYYSDNSSSVEHTIKTKIAEKQLSFLKADPLQSEVPATKIFFIKQHWFISIFLGPYSILNAIRGVESKALTPVFASVVFINKTSNLYIDSSYLAHELVHILQHDKYGYFTTRFKTPTWVAEGYATYRQAQFEDVPINNVYVSDSYKLYATLVKHAITINKKTIDELHLGKVDYDATLKSLCEIKKEYWGCKGNNSAQR